MHPAPRVAPVVEHLAAERMAADAPEVLIALLFQVLVADHDVVHVGGLVGQVVQPRLVAADAEEDVVIDIILAAVEAVERADDVLLLVGIDLVRAAEAEHLAVPAEGLLELRRVHDEMADALDMRGPLLDPVERVAAPRLVLADIDRRPDYRDFRQLLHAVDDLDLEPVRVREAHALAATGLVEA